MNYLVGLSVALASIYMALVHLDQSPEHFYDFVALAIVLGGTFALSLIILPWRMYKRIFYLMGALIFHRQHNKKEFLESCVQAIQNYRATGQAPNFKRRSIQEKILADGFEMVSLGIKTEKIEMIIRERIYHYINSDEQIANSLKSLAKYPPALGLTGTVFGLVELMRAVSSGMPAKETGVKMSIALVATMYGLLVANLIVNPAGEQIAKIIKSEEGLCEISLMTVLMASQTVSLLEAQEMLNSMVFEDERVDLINNMELFEESA